jgi:hypothetical protein
MASKAGNREKIDYTRGRREREGRGRGKRGRRKEEGEGGERRGEDGSLKQPLQSRCEEREDERMLP